MQNVIIITTLPISEQISCPLLYTEGKLILHIKTLYRVDVCRNGVAEEVGKRSRQKACIQQCYCGAQRCVREGRRAGRALLSRIWAYNFA